MRNPCFLPTCVLLCLCGTAGAQTPPGPAQLNPVDAPGLSQPSESDLQYDLPKIFRPIVSEPSTFTPSADAQATDADSTAAKDDEPLPWNEFFKVMTEEANNPRPAARPGAPQDGRQAPISLAPSILAPEGGLASRLVGAFRVRREKEQAFKDYIQDQSTQDRLITRLEGLYGNTALIVVTERYEQANPATRHEAAMRWGNRWAEINATQISRLVLYSLRQGEIASYDFLTDRYAPLPDGSSPLAMLSEPTSQQNNTQQHDPEPSAPVAEPLPQDGLDTQAEQDLPETLDTQAEQALPEALGTLVKQSDPQ